MMRRRLFVSISLLMVVMASAGQAASLIGEHVHGLTRAQHAHVVGSISAFLTLAGILVLRRWILGPWIAKPWLPSHSQAPPLAHVSATAWAALAISGLACTATTTLLWNWGIHHVPASRAGVFLNIEPAMGSLLGVKLLGEHLGPYAWFGGALILGAAITLTTRGHEPEPPVILE